MVRKKARKVVKTRPAVHPARTGRRLPAREGRHLLRLKAAHAKQHEMRHRDAVRAWDSLTLQQQFELARQLVETRDAELRAAHRGVIAVTYGYGTSRASSRSGAVRRKIKRAVCVTFVVRRKRDKERGASHQPEDVPKFLYAYHTDLGGEPARLCALPTDVEDRRHLRLSTHQNQVLVRANGLTDELGVLTCLVRKPGDARLYALSCRHVLGLTDSNPTDFPLGAEVSLAVPNLTPGGPPFAPSAPVLATTIGAYGILVNQDRVSFDVALARVDETNPAVAAALASAVDGIVPPRYAASLDEITRAQNCVIRTPDGPLALDVLRGWASTLQLPVKYSDQLTDVYQGVLVVESLLRASAQTRPGYSGSPVMGSDDTGPLLLGMHFAGAGGTSYMIPAYELVRTSHYLGLPNGQTLTIV